MCAGYIVIKVLTRNVFMDMDTYAVTNLSWTQNLNFNPLSVTLTLNWGTSKYPGAQVHMLTSNHKKLHCSSTFTLVTYEQMEGYTDRQGQIYIHVCMLLLKCLGHKTVQSCLFSYSWICFYGWQKKLQFCKVTYTVKLCFCDWGLIWQYFNLYMR